MQCPRCHGFLVRDHLYDQVVDSGKLCFGEWRWAWRCVCCGNFLDPVVLKNRQMQQAGQIDSSVQLTVV